MPTDDSDRSTMDAVSTIEQPPQHMAGILQRLGPGLIIAGSIVGSGELIATTTTGAEAGFYLLWLILIGCVIKVFCQVELGRYTITSGKTTRFGFDQPFPVYVAYWTVVPDGKGSVKKLADLYGRDAPVVASFAKPGRPTAVLISPTPPPVVPTTTTAARQAAPARTPTATAPGTSGIY